MKEMYQRLFVLNPVLEESARARRKFFRSTGQPGKFATYFVLILILLMYIWLLFLAVQGGGETVSFALMVQLILITLVLPGSIYGAISGEREKSTWDALVLTRLTPGQIVFGKIFWRVKTMLWVMVFFLPLLLMGVYGNAHPLPGNSSYSGQGEARSFGTIIVLSELMTFCWGLLLLSFGLFVSSKTSRSVSTAAIVICSLLFVLVMCPVLVSITWINGNSEAASWTEHPLTWLVYHVNSFEAVAKMDSQSQSSAFLSSTHDSGGYGAFQIVTYLVLAAAFAFGTYRGLKRGAGTAKS